MWPEIGDQHGLVFSVAQHVIVGIICHRIYVGRGLRAALSLVSSYHRGGVDREPFVGVDGDTEEARVCVDHPASITLAQVVQYGCLVEVRHHGHVLQQVEAGRVHGLQLSFANCQHLLVFGLHVDSAPSSLGLDLSFHVSILFIRYPDPLLPIPQDRVHLHQLLVALAEVACRLPKFTHIHHGSGTERWRRRH